MFFQSIKNERVDYQCLDQIGHQTSDLYLCYCGIEFCPYDHRYGPIVRDEYLVHFVFQGRGFYQINGITHKIETGQAFFIPPGINTVYYADASDPYAYVWVAFGGDKAKDYLALSPLSIQHPVCDLHFPVDDFRLLTDKIMNAKELTISNDIKRVGYLYHILGKLIASNQIHSTETIKRKHRPASFAEKAKKYIELNYDHISVADVVKHVSVNRSYLYSIFKTQYGVSLQDYIIQYRLGEASKLLLSTVQTITQISRLVGYQDSMTFSKSFKKHFGLSPRQYRETAGTTGGKL